MLSVIDKSNNLIIDDILSNAHMEKLKQWFSIFLMMQPLNILPHIVVTIRLFHSYFITVILLLLRIVI